MIDVVEMTDVLATYLDDVPGRMQTAEACAVLFGGLARQAVKTDVTIELLDLEHANIEAMLAQIKRIAAQHAKQLGFVRIATVKEQAARGRFAVCVHSGNVVGFCNFNVRKRDAVGVVYEIVTTPLFCRCGLAVRMLRHVLEQSPAGEVELKCPTDNESNAFYRRIAFHRGTVPGKLRTLETYTITSHTLSNLSERAGLDADKHVAAIVKQVAREVLMKRYSAGDRYLAYRTAEAACNDLFSRYVFDE